MTPPQPTVDELKQEVRGAAASASEPALSPSATEPVPVSAHSGDGQAHTPLPWSTHQSHVYAPDGAILAQVHNPGSKCTDYPLVANAEFIVRACNSHYELIEALEPLVGAATARALAGEAYIDDARAALAKARGDGL
jgi:hypothetical protein